MGGHHAIRAIRRPIPASAGSSPRSGRQGGCCCRRRASRPTASRRSWATLEASASDITNKLGPQSRLSSSAAAHDPLLAQALSDCAKRCAAPSTSSSVPCPNPIPFNAFSSVHAHTRSMQIHYHTQTATAPADALAITLDREPFALRSTRNRPRTAVRRGAAGRRGGRAGAWYCERQSRAGRWPTAEPSWLRALRALSRGTRLGVQRAAVGRGGPGGADAGRAFVTVSASSASVRCPERASSVRVPVHANCCPVSGVAPGCPPSVVQGEASGVRALPCPLCPTGRSWRGGGGVGSRTAAMAGLVVARVVGQWAGRLGGLPGSARCTPRIAHRQEPEAQRGGDHPPCSSCRGLGSSRLVAESLPAGL